MAHFAELNENNVVISVLVVNNGVITENNEEKENLGIDFLNNIYGHNRWVQTSYNGKFRYNYAGIGFIYDEIIDAFIPPKCHDEAIVNENALWDCLNIEHTIALELNHDKHEDLT